MPKDANGYFYPGLNNNVVAGAFNESAFNVRTDSPSAIGGYIFLFASGSGADQYLYYRRDNGELLNVGDLISGSSEGVNDFYVNNSLNIKGYITSSVSPHVTFSSSIYTPYRLGVGKNNFDFELSDVALTSNARFYSDNVDDLAGVLISRTTDNPVFGGHAIFARTRGTKDAPTAILNDDKVLRIIGAGHDGVGHEVLGVMEMAADGNVTNTSSPGRISFYTTPSGSTTEIERMRIGNDGTLVLSGNLDVSGSIILRESTATSDVALQFGKTPNRNGIVSYDDIMQFFNAGTTAINITAGAITLLRSSTISDTRAMYFGGVLTNGSGITSVNANAQLAFGLGTLHNRALLITDRTTWQNAYGHPAYTNPTLVIHSVTPSATATNEFVRMSHNTTDFNLETGKGNINLIPASGITNFSGALETGGLTTSFLSKTADYTLTVSDYFVSVDTSSNTVEITLPTAVGCAGRHYVIKRVNTGANVLTVSTTTSQTIDGALTQEIHDQWVSMALISDGANWLII